MSTDGQRIPLITRPEWTTAAREVFGAMEGPDAWENGSNSAVVNTLARHPSLTKPFLDFNKYLLFECDFPLRIRQIVIMRVGWVRCADVIWASHLRMSEQLGLSSPDCQAIKVGPADAHWASFERTVLEAVDALCAGRELDDATWNALAAEFDHKRMLEFLFLVGNYSFMAIVLNGAKVDMEPSLKTYIVKFGSTAEANG